MFICLRALARVMNIPPICLKKLVFPEGASDRLRVGTAPCSRRSDQLRSETWTQQRPSYELNEQYWATALSQTARPQP